MSCKPNRFDAASHPSQWLLVVVLLLAMLVLPVSAGTATKAGSGTDLTSAGVGVWSGGSGANGSPTSADVATWTSSSLGVGLTIGSASSWGSINVLASGPTIDITGAGTLTITNGIILDTAAGDMSFTNAITLGANQTWNIGANRTVTTSGAITGSKTLTKDGAGTLIKSSASDANSGMIILAGTLKGKPTSNAGTLTIAKNGTWDLSPVNRTVAIIADGTGGGGLITSSLSTAQTLATGNASDTSFSGVLENGSCPAITLNKQNAGKLTLSGTNTFSGSITITAGTLNIGGAGQLGSGSFAGNIANSGTFSYSSSASQTLTGVISGAGALTQNGPGTLTLLASNTYSGTTTVSGGVLAVSSAQTGTGTISVSDGSTLKVYVSSTNQIPPSTLIVGSSSGGALEFNGITSKTTEPIKVTGALTIKGSASIKIDNLPTTAVAGDSYPLVTYGSGGSGTLILTNMPAGYTGHLTNGSSRISLVIDTNPSIASTNLVLNQTIPGDTRFYPQTNEVWNLAAYQYVQFDLENMGTASASVRPWVFAKDGWGASGCYPTLASDTITLPAKSRMTLSIDLSKRFFGTENLAYDKVIDPSKIIWAGIMFSGTPQPVAVHSIQAVGTAPDEPPQYLGSTRILIPEISEGAAPGAGKRVRQKLPGYEGTDIEHILYLPTDYDPQKKYPVIVETPGSEFYDKFCYSPGIPEQCRYGWGLAKGLGDPNIAGDGFIWLCLPFINDAGTGIQISGWGNVDLTARYFVDAINYVCDQFGGDSGKVIYTGFSRGEFAANMLCLHSQDTSEMIYASHIDPTTLAPADVGGWDNMYVGWNDRVTNNYKGQPFFGKDVYMGANAHVDCGYLEDRPVAVEARQWVVDVLKAFTTNSPAPVSRSWLEKYKLVGTNSNAAVYEAAAMADADGDGYLAWQEFVLGTDPTVSSSRFIAKFSMSNGVPVIGWTPDMPNRRYSIDGRSNLIGGGWESPTNLTHRFFRINVNRR